MPVLAVNVDHVATLRQQRHAAYPDPLAAAREAERAGAQCIIAHLREDRRHIQDADIDRLSANITTRLNLEMAATSEMQSIALGILPYIVCVVPEKREELTTEGGLAVAGRETELRDFLAPLKEKGVKSSLFIEADPLQVDAAKAVGSDYIELHTGHYADAAPGEAQDAELRKILAAIRHAHDIGVAVNLGHGLDYDNIHAFSETPGVSEYSIGFAIVAQAVFVGMHEAVRQMWNIIRTFPE